MLEKGLLFLAISLTILTLGRFVFWCFPLELLTHFQVHYFLLTIALMPISLWLRQSQQIKSQATLLILLFTFAVNGLELGAWYFPNNRIDPGRTNILRVMSFNINVNNSDVDRTVDSIKSIDPDLILIVEVDPAMKQKIEIKIGNRFPYSFRSPGGGMAVFSKLALTDSSGQKFLGTNGTNLVTHIRYRDRQIQIIGTHPLVPVKVDRFYRRNLQIISLANHLEQELQPTILMGDFNLTPWSPYYRQFIDKTKLHNTRRGFGILPTWIRPSTAVNLPHSTTAYFPQMLLPILNIPIDHIFVSKDFRVARTHTGDNGNSDHAPIISELVIP